ncbi:hypothetical protein [Campylobacter sputorum]|uniref:hypothetical protein n=1 Tax=Campylobacter sputorum TaxID=206 RepID=UPI001E33ED8A|nr:hypothetical protein [Campylobacter sputorum]
MYDYSDNKVNLVLSLCFNNDSVKDIYKKVTETFYTQDDAKEFVYEQLNCYYHSGDRAIVDFLNIPKENFLSDSILNPRFNTEAGTIALFECMALDENEGIAVSMLVTIIVIINYEIRDYKNFCYKFLDFTFDKIKFKTNNTSNKNTTLKTILTIFFVILIIFLVF